MDSLSKRKKLKAVKKAKITWCVPQVGCTRCWAVLIFASTNNSMLALGVVKDHVLLPVVLEIAFLNS